MLVSGVEEFGLLLFGVELEEGFEVLFGFEEFMSLLLELELGDVLLLELESGEVLLLELLELDGVLLELDGEVEFMSELLPVVEDGEVEVLEPLGLDCVDGVLCELLVPLPAPFASLPLLLWATAMPVEKITAVAIVKSFLLIRDVLLSAGLASFHTSMASRAKGLHTIESCGSRQLALW